MSQKRRIKTLSMGGFPQHPTPMAPEINEITLDGRTLEGGGQLVRNAVALSAITRKPVTIHHIRHNRAGKKGLKGSHVAGVKFLADMSSATATGAEIGSSSLHFVPQRHDSPNTDPQGGLPLLPEPEYTITLPTAGSVFLVFQTLYPYLLAILVDRPIKLNLSGGTNVSFSPSFEYISQVLIPNFARLGLPRIEVELNKRGWATGPVELGSLTLSIPARGPGLGRFPALDTSTYLRGKVARVEITILAPDTSSCTMTMPRPGDRSTRQTSNRDETLPRPTTRSPGDGEEDETASPRHLIQNETLSLLRERMQELPDSLFQIEYDESCSSLRPPLPASPVPIAVHSEQTFHRTHIYILIVAHTSTGFRLGRDALYGARTESGPRRKKDRAGSTEIKKLVRRCIDGFIEEIATRKSCLDVYMQDQAVVFEALGGNGKPKTEMGDEREWSLHTRTAKWVCDQFVL